MSSWDVKLLRGRVADVERQLKGYDKVMPFLLQATSPPPELLSETQFVPRDEDGTYSVVHRGVTGMSSRTELLLLFALLICGVAGLLVLLYYDVKNKKKDGFTYRRVEDEFTP